VAGPGADGDDGAPGGERHPLVKLRDEEGREVRVTDTHPMVTAARGVVQAGS